MGNANNADEKVVLVDEADNDIGSEEKIKAHENGGVLHRAFSIFIFNDRGEMLLQKRADHKYHCGGLWTNTCCSHPRPGESLSEATHRKLLQEMGFDTDLKEILSFTYRASFENGLTEHELDHVFIGFYNNEPKLNHEEASKSTWIKLDALETDVRDNPEKFTPWFKIVLEKVIEWYNANGPEGLEETGKEASQ